MQKYPDFGSSVFIKLQKHWIIEFPTMQHIVFTYNQGFVMNLWSQGPLWGH